MTEQPRDPDSDQLAKPPVGYGNPVDFWVHGAIPAATSIIVRDSDDEGIETLMLKRDSRLAFAGGMWVFPGGRIDPRDLPAPGSLPASASGTDLEDGAINAAVRETAEETGLHLAPADLVRWTHWTAPVEAPRRFTTSFYVTGIPGERPLVTIDDGEIREFRWLTPQFVIERNAAGELGLTPPTYITLTQLSAFRSVADLLGSARDRPVEHFATHWGFEGETMVAMYHGDAGYESSDIAATGRRHRLTMGTPWSYVRDV